MTYTFKLARRLAVSRRLSLLPAILLFAACNDDATAPGDPLGTQVAVAVSVNPRTVTIETNQLIRFLAYGSNSVGDTVHAPITWRATGGTILPDGRFSSVATGKFLVTGAVASMPGAGPGGSRGRDEDRSRVDTSIVEVVRRWPLLQSIEISPAQVTLAPGGSQSFLAIGRLKDGRAVPVGTVWDAFGGTIDAGGNFVAGQTAGTYKVIATNWTMLISDTALVTITAPPAGEPPLPEPPLPEEPPAPVLEKVTLVPASATLAPFTTRKFVAFGHTVAGDSMPLTLGFTATGGTVTEDGSYSAGSTAGAFRVIFRKGSLADTSTVVVTSPLGSGPGAGIPMGLGGLMAAGVEPGAYTMTMEAIRADNIVARLNEARAKKLKVMMAMTGGAHANYITNGKFDMAKWKARMDTYKTPAIKAAVAAGVADGTIVGNSVIDEPNNTSVPPADHNSWGPEGTVTKAMVDEMARYVKAIFPTMPVGFAGRYDWRDGKDGRPNEILRDVDFAIRQYSWRKPDGDPGNIARYRSEALAQGAREGLATMFSMNVLNGGIRVPPATWICPLSTTGGRGQSAGTCRMHSSQLLDWGNYLASASCGLMMWRYDADFFSNSANRSALGALAASLGNLPRKGCTGP